MKNKTLTSLVVTLIVLVILLIIVLNSKSIKGTYVADGTQILQIKEIKNGKPIYMEENPNPYYLTIKGSKKFTLEIDDEKYIGTYSKILKKKEEYVFSPKGNISFTCKLDKYDDLICDKFATKFVRK